MDDATDPPDVPEPRRRRGLDEPVISRADRGKVNRKQQRYRKRKLWRLMGWTEAEIEEKLREMGLGADG